MSRQVVNDFNILNKFIEDYKISPLLDNPSFVNNISQQHKKYYSYLVLLGELSNTKPVSVGDRQFAYFLESCSDVGNSFFSSMNGSYKTANLILRSSIENFIKAVFYDKIPGITVDKSVYSMVDNVKLTSEYNDIHLKVLFDKTFACYKTLCRDMHTADSSNMMNLTALKYFPTYDETKASNLKNKLVLLVTNYITIFSMMNKDYVLRIHHLNRDTILSSVIKKYRPYVHGIC